MKALLLTLLTSTFALAPAARAVSVHPLPYPTQIVNDAWWFVVGTGVNASALSTEDAGFPITDYTMGEQDGLNALFQLANGINNEVDEYGAPDETPADFITWCMYQVDACNAPAGMDADYVAGWNEAQDAAWDVLFQIGDVYQGEAVTGGGSPLDQPTTGIQP